MKKKNIAIIGIGNWGKNLLRTFTYLKIFKFLNDKNIKSKINKPKNIILKNKKIKTIIISTPINTHAKLIIKAIKYKKNIFVEKPITTNIKNLNKIINKIKNKNLQIMCGYLLLYHTAFIKMRTIINKYFYKKIINIYTLRTDQIHTKNNIIWDYGPHDISMINKIIKSYPNKIKITSNEFEKIPKKIKFKLLYNNKINTYTHLSWKKQKQQKISINKKKKLIIFDDKNPWNKKLKVINKLTKTHIYIKIKKKEPLLNECQYFYHNLLKKKIMINDSQNIIKILETINKKYKIKKYT